MQWQDPVPTVPFRPRPIKTYGPPPSTKKRKTRKWQSKSLKKY